jgi:hypothetical protein
LISCMFFFLMDFLICILIFDSSDSLLIQNRIFWSIGFYIFHDSSNIYWLDA